MAETTPGDEPRTITELLVDWRAGDDAALRVLMPRMYDELRRMAQRSMSAERQGHTLSATSLVHESFLRLIEAQVPWQDRAHFLAVSARVMRRILVDHGRAKSRQKRGGNEQLLSLDGLEIELPGASQEIEVLALSEAIDQLRGLDEAKAETVELIFFGGLSYDEVAEVLGLSRATVHRHLTFAKAWLFDRLRSRSPSEADAEAEDC